MYIRKTLALFFCFIGLISLTGVFTSSAGVEGLISPVIYFGLAAWIYWPIRPAAVRERARQEEIKRLREDEIRRRVADIRNGSAGHVETDVVRLKDGESAIFAAEAILLEKQLKGFEGSRTSVNVRLTKSISVGQSAYRGKQQKELAPVTAGELVVTNRRVVFAGELKSFDIAREKLTNHHNLGDGILLLHVGSKTYTVMVESGNDALFDAALAA